MKCTSWIASTLLVLVLPISCMSVEGDLGGALLLGKERSHLSNLPSFASILGQDLLKNNGKPQLSYQVPDVSLRNLRMENNISEICTNAFDELWMHETLLEAARAYNQSYVAITEFPDDFECEKTDSDRKCSAIEEEPAGEADFLDACVSAGGWTYEASLDFYCQSDSMNKRSELNYPELYECLPSQCTEADAEAVVQAAQELLELTMELVLQIEKGDSSIYCVVEEIDDSGDSDGVGMIHQSTLSLLFAMVISTLAFLW